MGWGGEVLDSCWTNIFCNCKSPKFFVNLLVFLSMNARHGFLLNVLHSFVIIVIILVIIIRSFDLEIQIDHLYFFFGISDFRHILL